MKVEGRKGVKVGEAGGMLGQHIDITSTFTRVKHSTVLLGNQVRIDFSHL